ncbi:thioredoxin fold domain-containing protein [Gammaproteobacteria bacterium]|nr:thioredoxin fold domain-containing protein [Gammaproteobacteria bacterium]MDA9117538.1 thioredoxin fold domain-containing protein [Gammaproteobacteria bacterium]
MKSHSLYCIFFLSLFSYTNTIEEKVLAVLPPESKIESIEESVIDGLFKVYFGDLQPLYVSEDGNYFIYGDLYQIEKGSVKNLSIVDLDNRRKVLLDAIPVEDLIQYKSENQKHNIFVFTDVDCGYCRKFHSQISEYNNLGISVNYAAFPRSGIDGETYQKMVSVWCSDDKKNLLSTLKEDGEIKSLFCTNQPITEQYNLGKNLGVTGTPAIFTSNGSQIKGYVPPDELIKRLME